MSAGRQAPADFVLGRIAGIMVRSHAHPVIGGNSMFFRNAGQIFVIVIALTAFCSGAIAEETVYKWVDEDGQVHFGDAPPADSNPAEAEVLVIPKSPPSAVPSQPAAKPVEADDKKQTMQPAKEMPQLHEKTDITQLSLAELDLRCEGAREKMIAPLRDAEIAKCKQNKREDPAFCERTNADFGDGGRTLSGGFRPRLFDDLPECQEALQERNRRGR